MFSLAVLVLLPLSWQEHVAFATTICLLNSGFRTRGQQWVFSESTIIFSVVAGYRGHIWSHLKRKCRNEGWIRWVKQGGDCLGHGLGRWDDGLERCLGFPWAHRLALLLLGAACGLRMHYLRRARWSRAWSLGTEPGLRLGSTPSCLGQLRPVT